MTKYELRITGQLSRFTAAEFLLWYKVNFYA